MNSKKARKIRQDLRIKPPKKYVSIYDPKHYRRLKSGQLVALGPRKAYKMAKKALNKEKKGSD